MLNLLIKLANGRWDFNLAFKGLNVDAKQEKLRLSKYTIGI
jgi:hypothetical protein